MDEINIVNDANETSNDLVKTLPPRREIIIEDLQKTFDQQLDKIKEIKDFMSLFANRNEIRTDLTDLKQKTIQLKNFLAEARDGIHVFKTVQVPQTELLIKNMREQHLQMLEKLAEIDNSEMPLSNDIDGNNNMTSDLTNDIDGNNNMTSDLTNDIDGNNNMTSDLTTRQSLSKFVTVMPKLHEPDSADQNILCYLNKFEYHIDPDEFNNIPKIDRGVTVTLDEVSSFLQDVVIKCFYDKYSLINQDSNNVLADQMKLWRSYRSQIEYCPGKKFITEGDIRRLTQKTIDRQMKNRISIIKRLLVIQEEMHKGSICYIWKEVK